jgi:hypothetical protein
MRQLTKEHTDYVLEVLISAEQLERLFKGGSLEWVQQMIKDMDMMLELRHRVQNHIKFDEIIETNYGLKNVE